MAARKHRILVMLHPTCLAQPSSDKMSRHVCGALEERGHTLLKLGVDEHLRPLDHAIEEWQPDLVFNLLEEFQNEAGRDQGVVSYLELMGLPYTGCNPHGLMLARDKALSKKILTYHNIRTPQFEVFPRGVKFHPPRALRYPLIVKSLTEEASLGLSQSSLVTSDEKLRQRVEFMHQSIGTAALVEEFVDGRELTVSLLGNERVQAFPVWELDISGLPQRANRIATRRVKWDAAYQKRHRVQLIRATGLAQSLQSKIIAVSKHVYRILGLSGYCRMDFRLSPDGKVYFLEANANPDISRGEEFASAALATGIEYPELMQRLVNLGLSNQRRLGATG